MDKRNLSERDICTKFITPAFLEAGWTQEQFREEVITEGRIVVRGNLATREKNPERQGGPKRADYVLYAAPKTPLAVVEAKQNKFGVGHGMQQALAYAEMLNGDLLICEGGEPGRCAIWDSDPIEMYFQKALHRIRPCNVILSQVLAMHLWVDCNNAVLEKYFTGATIKHLSGRSLNRYPVPIPPLAEQKRIVAKVDELMALCDTLEAKLRKASQVQEQLAISSIAALTGIQSQEKETMKAPTTELVEVVP